jgi:hypothetical protein
MCGSRLSLLVTDARCLRSERARARHVSVAAPQQIVEAARPELSLDQENDAPIVAGMAVLAKEIDSSRSLSSLPPAAKLISCLRQLLGTEEKGSALEAEHSFGPPVAGIAGA